MHSKQSYNQGSYRPSTDDFSTHQTQQYTNIMRHARTTPVASNSTEVFTHVNDCLGIGWQATFKGCPTTSSQDPQNQCKVNPRSSTHRIADLNQKIYERGIVTGAKWDPYKHHTARQLHMQFLYKDIKQTGNSYTKPIENMSNTFCATKARLGHPPEFTNF